MSSRKIKEIIHQQSVLCVDESTLVQHAARLMSEQNVGSIMITHHGVLTGIFTERDLLNRVVAANRDPGNTKLAEVMTRNPQTINADRLFSYAMHLMYEGGFRHLPVVDPTPDGQPAKPIGIISIRDALGLEMSTFEAELEWRNALTESMM
ncbi:MAG: CBS domain-containing protein [Pseudomonadota bacterium]